METQFSQYLDQMAGWRKPLPATQLLIDYAHNHSAAGNYSYACTS
jgi:hypothetical protein